METASPPAAAYVDRPGHHSHQCGVCGNVWEHADSCFESLKEHRCPFCRKPEWYRYDGTLAPDNPAP
jgi:hypothetical protein